MTEDEDDPYAWLDFASCLGEYTLSNTSPEHAAWCKRAQEMTVDEMLAEFAETEERIRPIADAIKRLDERIRAIIGCWYLGLIGRSFRFMAWGWNQPPLTGG